LLADQLCPECHGKPTLEYVAGTHMRKRCTECGHRWLEVRPPDPALQDSRPLLQVPIAEARRMSEAKPSEPRKPQVCGVQKVVRP